MSRTHFKSRKSVKVFSVGIAMTFVAFLFQGLSFFVLATAVHEHIGLLESFMATSASTALATLPITIGGSGLAELGIWAYISNLGGIPHFADILNDSQLSVVIAWRIATYHIPLVIMWICLMKITIGKGSITIRSSNSKDDKTTDDDGNNIGTNNGENDTESPKIYSSNESPENSSPSSSCHLHLHIHSQTTISYTNLALTSIRFLRVIPLEPLRILRSTWILFRRQILWTVLKMITNMIIRKKNDKTDDSENGKT